MVVSIYGRECNNVWIHMTGGSVLYMYISAQWSQIILFLVSPEIGCPHSKFPMLIFFCPSPICNPSQTQDKVMGILNILEYLRISGAGLTQDGWAIYSRYFTRILR